jgi:hypothetical protein
MAAGVRSDCRIVRAGAGMRAHGSERRGHRRMLPTTQRKSGRVDLHLKSARKATIMVALTGRGRGQQHRLRGMSTRIRALVHEQSGRRLDGHPSRVTVHKGLPGGSASR